MTENEWGKHVQIIEMKMKMQKIENKKFMHQKTRERIMKNVCK